MQEIIDEKDWAAHPFLSKLTVSSDYDGDAAYRIENPTPEHFEESKKVALESSINGSPWEAVPFADSTAFINESSMAWYFSFNYHPLFEVSPELKGRQVHNWRAVITKEPSS
jgi:hypothetical protein